MSSDRTLPAKQSAEASVPKPSGEISPQKTPDKDFGGLGKAKPKTVGLGKETKVAHSTKKHSPISLPQDYRRELAIVARTHRKKYKLLFATDPTLKDRAARFYRSKLPPLRRPGRPGIDSVTTAVGLLRIIKRRYSDETPACWWRRIYPLAIPNYETLNGEQQRVEKILLRERVKSRRSQQRRRRSKRNRSAVIET